VLVARVRVALAARSAGRARALSWFELCGPILFGLASAAFYKVLVMIIKLFLIIPTAVMVYTTSVLISLLTITCFRNPSFRKFPSVCSCSLAPSRL
jgi:hypothetical protein